MSVYTVPEYRRQGHAGKLLEMAIEGAHQRDVSYIELKATDDGFSLYQKAGFVTVEEKYINMKYRIN